MRSTRRKTTARRITLRDVINHMEHMEQRLSARLDAHDQRFNAIDRQFTDVKVQVQHLNVRIDRLETRIIALDEDLTATMGDIVFIRKHIGIPVLER